jgi:hypothetical protein
MEPYAPQTGHNTKRPILQTLSNGEGTVLYRNLIMHTSAGEGWQIVPDADRALPPQLLNARTPRSFNNKSVHSDVRTPAMTFSMCRWEVDSVNASGQHHQRPAGRLTCLHCRPGVFVWHHNLLTIVCFVYESIQVRAQFLHPCVGEPFHHPHLLVQM